MTTALLIIDVQQALCAGEYQCFEIDRVIATINDLSQRARDAGVPVVLIQHEERTVHSCMGRTVGDWLTVC